MHRAAATNRPLAARGDGVDIRLLGAVEVALDGALAALGGPRQHALLALLALRVGETTSTDRLIDELWVGEPPPGAERTLRSYVSRLRQVLGRDAVVARGGGYALGLDPGCIDAVRFERLLEEGCDALGRGAVGVAADRLRAGLALWRGRALADVAEHGALAAAAARWDDMRLRCVEQRIEADLALGRHEAVVVELQALVHEQPLRERLWSQLVLALYRCGRQADALTACRQVRRLLRDELGLEPGPDLRQLEEDVLRQQVAPARSPGRRHNLPATATRLIGRDHELADLDELLRHHRLVTVTGMGGSGKTRLALQAASRHVDDFTDGVWFVDLTSVTDPELVVAAVATAVDADLTATSDPITSLVDEVRQAELLIVLDNCEHLLTACAEMTSTLVGGCPHVRVLATSRAALGVYGEHDYRLGALAAPRPQAGTDELCQSPAVQLFLERAAAVRRGAPTDDDLAVVGEICRELEGLPLAIELAAARAKALSLTDVASRLDDRLRFLRAWQRMADPRHRTLQTTMDWSYDLLAPAEQELLRRLAVFAGGATLESLADVCLDGDHERAVELLEGLVAASLVIVQPGSPTRYRLLETVRQYAADRLAADPMVGVVRRRHADHFLRLAEAANLSIESVGRGPQKHEPVLREQHNLRAALDWAADADAALGLRILVALENFWVTQAMSEGARRFEQILARADHVDPRLRARAERDYAACFDVLQDLPRAEQGYRRSRGLFEECGDEVGVAGLDFRLGVVALQVDEPDIEGVRATWEHSLEVFRRAGDEIGELQALGNLGGLDVECGDIARGHALIEAAARRAVEIGWWWWAALGFAALAGYDLDAGLVEGGERYAREALELAARADHRQGVLHALALLARAAVDRGDVGRALTLWAAVDATEDSPGRFGRFDREAFAALMPDLPHPAPLELDEAISVALSG